MSNPDLHDARGSVFLGNSREDRQRRVGTVGGFIGNCIETPEKRPLFAYFTAIVLCPRNSGTRTMPTLHEWVVRAFDSAVAARFNNVQFAVPYE